MKAAVYNRFGAPEVLALAEVERPAPAEGEVLIKVAGAGLNPVDAKLRSGSLDGLFPLSFPVIPGWDVSGTVEAVGAGVSEDWVGKRVFAYVRFDSVGQDGTCAQYCLSPVSFLAEVPATLDLTLAAGVPLVALTAYQSLVEQARIAQGQSALILAGGGAVGHYAIQIAKAAGAHVATTASPGDHAALADKGADQCINYRDADWAQQAKQASPDGFDVILDAVGGDTLAQSYALLASGGCMVGLNDPPDEAQVPSGARAVRLFSRGDGQQLSAIAAMMEDGKLTLDDTVTMPLAEVVKAHAMLDKGSKSKLVLVP